MASTYEKSVKGATKVKLAAPKSKYIEHLLMATEMGAVDQVFRPLGYRLKDSTWTIVYKGLIVAHIMIRDGAKEVALRYLAEQPRYFSVSHIAQVSEQGENIRDYARYLSVRVQSWRELKFDYASQRLAGDQQGRLKKLSVEKGLLREVEGVSRLTGALLKCKFYLADLSNDITLTSFRLLVSDLLALFQPLNEGVMNVLSHYFEMSRSDAERALRIYKTFVERTNDVIEYLSEAKSLEHALRLQIPNVKHAPTGLTQALEEYLNDPDFEANRRQYLEGKERGSVSTPTTSVAITKAATTDTKPAPSVRPDPTNPFNSLTGRQQSVGSPASTPAATPGQKQQNLVDFFNSIESEQTSMFPTPQQQQQAFPQQQQQTSVYTNPSFTPTYAQPVNQYPAANQQQTFYQSPQTYTPQQQFTAPQQPIRPEWTGAGFGGYTPSTATSPVHVMPTIPSAQPAPAPTQFTSPVQSTGLSSNMTGTNPFRASMMPPSASPIFSSEQSTNPFAAQRSQTLPVPLSQPQSYSSSQTSFASQPQTFQQPFQTTSPTSFQSPSQPAFQQSNQSQPAFTPQSTPPTQVSSPTGTNPFARPQQLAAPNRLTPQVTGTNPFRQSLMPGATGVNGFGWSQ